MKARYFIVRALLFALLLGPFALRASASHLGAPLCRIPKAQLHDASDWQSGGGFGQLLIPSPWMNRPSHQIHKNRGKKINVESGFVPTLICFGETPYMAGTARAARQEFDGPYPPRGPPPQLSL
jgi:hypothetical protein